MSKYHLQYPTKNIILLGDFNLTPRSYYYKCFDKNMKTVFTLLISLALHSCVMQSTWKFEIVEH